MRIKTKLIIILIVAVALTSSTTLASRITNFTVSSNKVNLEPKVEYIWKEKEYQWKCVLYIENPFAYSLKNVTMELDNQIKVKHTVKPYEVKRFTFYMEYDGDLTVDYFDTSKVTAYAYIDKQG